MPSRVTPSETDQMQGSHATCARFRNFPEAQTQEDLPEVVGGRASEGTGEWLLFPRGRGRCGVPLQEDTVRCQGCPTRADSGGRRGSANASGALTASPHVPRRRA